jgi:hypothetical protein
LCDAIKTVDSVLMDYVDSGFDVFHIQYKDPLQGFLNSFFDGWEGTTSINTKLRISKVVLGWISKKLLPLLNVELSNNPMLV